MTLIDKAEAMAVLRKAQTASCTCQIKTPDPEWHSYDCRYRILREAEAMIDHLPDADPATPLSAALAVPEVKALVDEMVFLARRLREWEGDYIHHDEAGTQWIGNVIPPLVRLEDNLAALRAVGD